MGLVENRKLRSVLEKVGLAAFALVVCFVLLEVIAIVFSGQSYALCVYEADPVLGWKLAPSLETRHVAPSAEYGYEIETNSRGERNPEFSIGEQDFLILGVGDSFLFGQGVEQEEIFLSVLEKNLEAKGKNVKAVNTGVSGYSTQQELKVLQNYLQEYDIDLVVVGFFAPNDVIGNAQQEPEFETFNGCLKAKGQEQQATGFDFKRFLKENTISYSFLSEKIRAVPPLRDFFVGIGLMQAPKPPEYNMVFQTGNERMEEAWQETNRLFGEMNELAEKNDFKVMVLDIPSVIQVDEGLRKKAFEDYGISEKGYDFGLPEKRMNQLSAGYDNLIFVETLDVFKSAHESLYYEIDPHWNREGHALAAQLLEKELLERGLV